MNFIRNHSFPVSGLFALVAILPSMAQAADVDVTFTVPVQIQNIHDDWSTVAVFCGPCDLQGGRCLEQKIGEVDVRNMARGSLNQTFSGTIKIGQNWPKWHCEFRINHTGQSGFPRPLQNEIKNNANTRIVQEF